MKKRILITSLIVFAGILFLSTSSPHRNSRHERIYEERVRVEEWMTTPFVMEEPLEVEEWMTKPFTIKNN